MIALKITDVKTFMSKLLVKDTFDELYVPEATISTYNTFQINGQLNKNYYSPEELESIGNIEYSQWKALRPFCFELIKGGKTPIFLKIIYMLPELSILEIIKSHDLSFTLDDVNGLFLNIKFFEGTLTCITGSSMKLFTMDKSLDQAFDVFIKKFLSKNDIMFEEL